ncbi:hypothetical protein BFP78_12295 [Gaetbulibacter sp. 5U11]|nr:hypothetical protein BFP78_12295 [Gaetbulibacter sp. 5U11]
MPYLVRRISRAKWDNEEFNYLENNNPPADAITSCLRTFNNELSTWLIDNLEDLNQAILCLVTGSKQENINTIQLIYFDIEEVEKRGLVLEKTPGDTVIEELKDSHFDIKDLNYDSLGIFKDIVLDCLRKDYCKTITRKSLKEILTDSVNKTKILDKSLLNEKLQGRF